MAAQQQRILNYCTDLKGTSITGNLGPESRQRTVCPFCPCPQLTAYWINPPSCLRRYLCENKFISDVCSCFSDSKQACIFLSSLFLAYIFIMEAIFYYHFRKANLVEDSKGGRADEIYSPFTHLSVKAVLNDQVSQYVHCPTAEYFETFIGLSKIFPFITPNVVTLAHFIVAFLAGKWISSDNLNDRRIGVFMFEFRSWLDTYDGSVYRAQPENHLKYTSDHQSWGFFIDSAADSVGGLFLCLGVFFSFLKRFGPLRAQCQLPFFSPDNSQDTQTTASLISVPIEKTYSGLYLFWKAFTYGLCLILGGIFWDNVVAEFTHLFQTPIADPILSELQNRYCHSYTSIIIFQMWRLIGSQSLIIYLLALIFFDKVWDFLKGYQYVLLGMVVVLYTVSAMYISYVRAQLHM